MTKIYHNPRCSKSRQTLQLLLDLKEPVEVILYLEDSPSKEQLTYLLSLLKLTPEQLVRKGESIWKEKYKGKKLTPSKMLDAMVKYPQLIERPIVVKDGKAVIGRPPESVKEIL